MKITKLTGKLMAVALIGAAFSLASCEKTTEGVSEDAANAVEAATEKAEEAADATEKAVDAAKEAINEAAKKVEEATAPAAQ